MALNENYNGKSNNVGNGTKYSPSVYSPYRMSNTENSIDPSTLTFTFWKETLKIAIAPAKAKANEGEYQTFDYENSIGIYLNHTKARILYEEISKFLAGECPNIGVTSGSAILNIVDGTEFGIKGIPCLVVRKLDDQGNAISAYAYQFKNDYHYSVRNYNAKTKEFDKVVDDYSTLELVQLQTLLKSYYEAMTGAIAFSVVDNMKYDQTRMNSKMDQIAAKLGVQFGAGTNKKVGGSSYFNNAPSGGGGYSSSTLDDIDDQFN